MQRTSVSASHLPPHLPVDKDTPFAEFEKIAAEYPVFTVRRTFQYGDNPWLSNGGIQ